MTTHLTEHQKAVLLLAEREEAGPFEDDCANEGLVWENTAVKRPRAVVNALVAKGLIELCEWWDEHVGYTFVLTDKGRTTLAALGEREAPDQQN